MKKKKKKPLVGFGDQAKNGAVLASALFSRLPATICVTLHMGNYARTKLL